MNKKYIVRLTEQERDELVIVIKKQARLCLQPTDACTIDIVAVLFRITPSSDNQ
jgi:hypothetical protein